MPCTRRMVCERIEDDGTDLALEGDYSACIDNPITPLPLFETV
jgi:hypothetical protein